MFHYGFVGVDEKIFAIIHFDIFQSFYNFIPFSCVWTTSCTFCRPL
ncbi:hypothetical protein T08_9479 [Trichinella sp. T8]|nr:hypothetical protein T08_9479 [Trichinella sp. T8]